MTQEMPLQNNSAQPMKFPYKRIIKNAWIQSRKNFKFQKLGIGIALLISSALPSWNPLNLPTANSLEILPIQAIHSQHELWINLIGNSFFALIILLLCRVGFRIFFTFLGLRCLMSAFPIMNYVFKKELDHISLTNPDESNPYTPQTKKNIKNVWISLCLASTTITVIVILLQWHLPNISLFYYYLTYGLNFISGIVVLLAMYITIEIYNSEISFKPAYSKIVVWVKKYPKEIVFTRILANLVTIMIIVVMIIIVFAISFACTLPMFGGYAEGFFWFSRGILILLLMVYIGGLTQAFNFAVNCLTYQQLDKMENPKAEVLPATE